MSRSSKKPRKQEVVALLKTRLFTRDRVLASYAALTEIEQRVLHRLLAHDGPVNKQRFERELVRAGIVATTQLNKEQRASGPPYARGERMASVGPGSHVFQDVVARLTLRGLVFSLPFDSDAGYGYLYKLDLHPAAALFVPAAVAAHLPALKPEPPVIPDWRPVHTHHQNSSALLRDLFLYWELCAAHAAIVAENRSDRQAHLARRERSPDRTRPGGGQGKQRDRDEPAPSAARPVTTIEAGSSAGWPSGERRRNV